MSNHPEVAQLVAAIGVGTVILQGPGFRAVSHWFSSDVPYDESLDATVELLEGESTLPELAAVFSLVDDRVAEADIDHFGLDWLSGAWWPDVENVEAKLHDGLHAALSHARNIAKPACLLHVPTGTDVSVVWHESEQQVTVFVGTPPMPPGSSSGDGDLSAMPIWTFVDGRVVQFGADVAATV